VGTLTIILAFQEPGRRPVSIASINDDPDDPELLQRLARVALKQAEERVTDLLRSNPTMAKLQAAELSRLRTSLEILVPGFDAPGAFRAM
jgi:hypothetical protein